jgi:hypothetical protein
MKVFSILGGLVFLGVMLWIGITVTVEYYKAKDLKGWERCRAVAQNSATMLWGKFSLFVAAIVANVDQFFDAIGLPQVSNAINQYVTPKTAAAFAAAVAVGSILARKRTL